MSDWNPEGPQLGFEEVGKMVDAIPDFEYSLNDFYGMKRSGGYIPLRGNHFLPMTSKNSERISIVRVESSKEFRCWKPREYINEQASQKERYHAVPYFVDNESRQIIDEWQEKGVLEEKIDLLHIKGVSAHLVRLLTHDNAPACRDFALACMKYLTEFTHDEIWRMFPDVADGDDMAQFWTIGPYILEALKIHRFVENKNENDKEDFDRVLLWLKRRIRTGEWGYDAIYPGVGDMRRRIHDLYLPRDGFHPIHKFIGKVGEHIASYLEKIPVTEEMVKNKERVRVKRERD